MQTLQMILLPALVPGFASTLVLLLAARAWRRDRDPDAARHARGAWTLPPLLAGALLLAFWSQEELLPFVTDPPRQSWHWVPVALVAASVPAFVAALLPPPRRASRRVAAGLGLALLAALPLPILLELPLLDAPLARAGVGAAAFVLAALLVPLGSGRPGASLPWTLMLAATAVSVLALEANFAKWSLVAAAPSAVAGTMLLAALLMRRWTAGPAPAALFGVVLAGLAATGHAYDYAGLGLGLWALAIAGPAALWLGELPGLRSRHGLAATLLRCGLGTAPAAAAIVLALLRAAASGDAGDGYGGY